MNIINTINFLNELTKNNSKEWFDKNRKQYEIAKAEFAEIITGLLVDVAKFDKEIQFLNVKDCMFRINRDVRFSNDKSPYKTNFGGFIVRGGKKSGFAGYYLHIQPGASFIGGGIYMPQTDILKAVRQDIYDNVDEFKKIINHKNFKKNFGEINGSKTTLAPKGFAKDFPEIDLLKFKDYTVMRFMSDKEVLGENFAEVIIATFKAMAPFNQFINRAVSYMREV